MCAAAHIDFHAGQFLGSDRLSVQAGDLFADQSFDFPGCLAGAQGGGDVERPGAHAPIGIAGDVGDKFFLLDELEVEARIVSATSAAASAEAAPTATQILGGGGQGVRVGGI